MADEIKTAIDATADAAKSATDAAGEAVKEASASAVRNSKQATAAAQSAPRRQAKAARAAAKKPARAAKPRRTARKAAAAPKPAVNERIKDVNSNSNWFAGFGNLPTSAPLQAFFNEAGERQQDAVRRSQKAVEELAELSRANVEALVDAGKIAVDGARSIGQDVVETSRESIEQAADAVRALAEAKSPTEFIQAQSEFARASFDRFVAESSRLTESFVKLAGEAFQPLSTRATLNAERINQFVA
jgi:phasin family protein